MRLLSKIVKTNRVFILWNFISEGNSSECHDFPFGWKIKEWLDLRILSLMSYSKISVSSVLPFCSIWNNSQIFLHRYSLHSSERNYIKFIIAKILCYCGRNTGLSHKNPVCVILHDFWFLEKLGIIIIVLLTLLTMWILRRSTSAKKEFSWSIGPKFLTRI